MEIGGDKNTRFFHHSAAIRGRINYIKAIKVDGEVIEDPSLALEKPFSEEEVWEAIAHSDINKAPGPDGLNLGFFKKFWAKLKDDMMRFFRISMWGRKRGLKGVVFKVDFMRAYDSVDWKILIQIMSKMGFGEKWRSWMFQCMSTAEISVLLNGSPTEKFHISRGLRQGCSLSPMLFNLATELLHLLLTKTVDMGLFSGFDLGLQDRAFKLSHLQFADDLIIFNKGSIRELRNIRRVLLIYELLVGLKLNLGKSRIFGINVEEGELTNWAKVIGCSVGYLPSECLGLPLGFKRNSAVMWDPIVARFNAKLSGWIANSLSIAEEWFWSNRISAAVILKLNSIMASFLWGDSIDKKKIHWVNWKSKVICDAYNLDPKSIILENSVPARASWIWKGVVKNFFNSDDFGECLKRNMCLKAGKGEDVQFWNDVWLGDVPLKLLFPRLYVLSINNQGCVGSVVLLENVECVIGDSKVAVMWSVWKCRNEIIFQKGKLDLVRLSFIVRFRVASWFSARFKDVGIPLDSLVGDLKIADSIGISGKDCSQPACWVPPPEGRGCPPILAEMLAIKRGICLMEELDFVANQRVILESDSSNALKWIQNPGLSPPLHLSLVKDIVSLLIGKDIIFRHISRAANWEADKLAKDGIG
ncbi:uncharacterized protein LOC120189350 [Hibiscus syriacus]|uniref:uncharacterized protein LOC120189350 n=1 Tax=Hibiscus syriacus TaxID=106335 RepID=UPI001924F5F4|nr:uncharacterized protein LOC120189350 [Hibiscus syriacus]